ncbi:hypothetical protein SLE2022_391510 [Rubroshorea leprosula]
MATVEGRPHFWLHRRVSCDRQTTSTLCMQQEHTCMSLEDCKQWLNSTCQLNGGSVGRGRCFCMPSFCWDSKAVNCIPDNENKNLSDGCFCRRMAISTVQRNAFEGKSTFLNEESDHGVIELVGFDEFQGDGTKTINVPFYDFEMIVAATDDFSVSNKFGQGGFGPLYKGKFPGEQEIAVKRLLRSSGPGLEESKNEVLLIAKLQHRNLENLNVGTF